MSAGGEAHQTNAAPDLLPQSGGSNAFASSDDFFLGGGTAGVSSTLSLSSDAIILGVNKEVYVFDEIDDIAFWFFAKHYGIA